MPNDDEPTTAAVLERYLKLFLALGAAAAVIWNVVSFFQGMAAEIEYLKTETAKIEELHETANQITTDLSLLRNEIEIERFRREIEEGRR